MLLWYLRTVLFIVAQLNVQWLLLLCLITQVYRSLLMCNDHKKVFSLLYCNSSYNLISFFFSPTVASHGVVSPSEVWIRQAGQLIPAGNTVEINTTSGVAAQPVQNATPAVRSCQSNRSKCHTCSFSWNCSTCHTCGCSSCSSNGKHTTISKDFGSASTLRYGYCHYIYSAMSH